MHTPNPGTDPHPDDRDEEQLDERPPPVPPDQPRDIGPQCDPPKPEYGPEPPMVVRGSKASVVRVRSATTKIRGFIAALD